MKLPSLLPRRGEKPWGLKFRSSVGFCTAVVFLSVYVDLLVYSVIVPVIPFRLEKLGYEHPSALVGWLLVAYSLGLIVATPPIAFFAEKYWSRQNPLIISLLLLIGSQVLFMEAKVYWAMCLARVIQGLSSAVVWVVAFSLLCDTVPEAQLGQQLGIVMSGLTLGFLVGPPVGGVLNDKLGYRSPFIFAICFCVLDLIGRLLIIEKDDAARWIAQEPTEETQVGAENENVTPSVKSRERSQLSVLKVIVKLGRSKRAFVAFVNVFIYGITFTITEPTLPLRLADVYGFTSLKVGIIYLATVVPSLFSTPLAGLIGDKIGVEWVTIACQLLSAPWWVVMAIRGPLALMVTSLALADFFLAAVVTPITADLAAVGRELDGIGYAHVFGAFNFAYSCASAVGPLIGGQIYARVTHGWTIIMGMSSGLILLSAVFAAYGAGENPIFDRLFRNPSKTRPSETTPTVGGSEPPQEAKREAGTDTEKNDQSRREP
ncbi:hypothetical protein FRC14_005784 [Serendipita sp. 396]|nr:hypothetical protein FRC14_005784 [Serendipita sp. 396]KAG8787103.1 hypothetical protein FRC15_009945 [Serendipita sp. 397]KAG8803066.1 hypothetical protein FRC16_007388 [Serendipita sp. 398]